MSVGDWISVKERLPGIETWALVFDSIGSMYVAKLDKHFQWKGGVNLHPTHWMLLPRWPEPQGKCQTGHIVKATCALCKNYEPPTGRGRVSIPVDECLAGRALDIVVAEKVMGWGYINSSRFGGWCWRYPDNVLGRLHESPPPYSTDIAVVWEIAEKFKHSSFGVGWSREWGVPYAMIGDSIYVYADTMPLAICRAALKAVDVEFVEVESG